jgi:hypothetical protein
VVIYVRILYGKIYLNYNNLVKWMDSNISKLMNLRMAREYLMGNTISRRPAAQEKIKKAKESQAEANN